MDTALYRDTDTLVNKSLEGDARSFQALYGQYCRAMYNTAFRILGNRADAEDILQESFLDAYRNLSRFSRKSTFGAWLKQIVIHKSINHLKKVKLILSEPEESADWDTADTEGHDPEGEALQIDSIRRAMQQLSPGFRAVLSLHLFEGYDHQEIAGILDMEPVTVRTQYIRGKKRLLQIIREGGKS